jgi:hypothetical protein
MPVRLGIALSRHIPRLDAMLLLPEGLDAYICIHYHSLTTPDTPLVKDSSSSGLKNANQILIINSSRDRFGSDAFLKVASANSETMLAGIPHLFLLQPDVVVLLAWCSSATVDDMFAAKWRWLCLRESESPRFNVTFTEKTLIFSVGQCT